MSFQIEMPQLSSEGESATLATWLVSVGDRVEKGEVIAELETDKATVELEAPVTGTIAELRIEEGSEEIAPGSVLGAIDPDEASAVAHPPPDPPPDPPREPVPASEVAPAAASAPDRAPGHASDGAPAVTPATRPAAMPGATPTAPSREGATSPRDSRAATPLARRVAAERGVDLETIEGSGARGRVVHDDVLRSAGETSGSGPSALVPAQGAQASGPVELELEAGFESVRLSAMRKTIARRMTESKTSVPHFYLRARCRMDELMRVRRRLNHGLADEASETKISVNDFIVRAAALSLRDVPAANVQFGGDVMRVFERVDVSVAVATEGGLVTPVLRDADRKGLTTIAEELGQLAVRARDGRLRPEEYQGGTFTVSNLGMYGIETVYPILNPPQACILGVGAAEEQPVVQDGQVAVGWVAALTLAADHRAVDGAVGARLLAALRAHLEDPMGMML